MSGSGIGIFCGVVLALISMFLAGRGWRLATDVKNDYGYLVPDVERMKKAVVALGIAYLVLLADASVFLIVYILSSK